MVEQAGCRSLDLPSEAVSMLANSAVSPTHRAEPVEGVCAVQVAEGAGHAVAD